MKMKKIMPILLVESLNFLDEFNFAWSIARPENNAKNSAPQSVNYCVTDFRRTPVRLQICSLQFALCSTAFFALFSGLAIIMAQIETDKKVLSFQRLPCTGCSFFAF